MLLRKIDGEMNVQNGGFFAKWRRWRHASRLTATAVIMNSRHRFSKRWHVADVKNIAGNDQTILMVHRNSANIACPFRLYVCLRLCDRYCCSAADGGSCHAPAPSYFEEITRCRRKKLDWRWPGNPNGRSIFRNLGLLTFTQSQLTLRWRLRGWWRLPEIAQTTGCQRQKHRRRWPGSIEIPQIRKFMPTRSSKTSRKTSFAATNNAAIDGIVHRLLFCYHSQWLLFSHSKNKFSTTEKPRYTYCRGFFVDSIYSKTIDIIRKKIFSI